MRLVLNLQGPDFEVGLSGDTITFTALGNQISFGRQHLPVLMSQLELVGRLIEISGAPGAAVVAAPAPVAPAAPAAVEETPAISARVAEVRARLRGELSPAGAPTSAPAAAPAPVASAPAAVPAVDDYSRYEPTELMPKRRARPAPPPGQRLHDYLHRFLADKGPLHIDELIAFVRRRKLSDADNLKLATTIALGRERTRFRKLSDGRWEAI